MNIRPRDTATLGGRVDWEPPPFTAAVTQMVDRLRGMGIEPSQILLPGPRRDEPIFTRFYGVPVALAPGADSVQLVVDVGEDISTRHAGER